MASSSPFDPLAAEAQPLKPSGGGRGLGGAAPLPEQVAPADEGEDEIRDSQRDAFVDASMMPIDAHEKEIAALREELRVLLPQGPSLPFSQAPRLSSIKISQTRVEGYVRPHLELPHEAQIESLIEYIESEYLRLSRACDAGTAGNLSLESFPSWETRQQIYTRARRWPNGAKIQSHQH